MIAVLPLSVLPLDRAGFGVAVWEGQSMCWLEGKLMGGHGLGMRRKMGESDSRYQWELLRGPYCAGNLPNACNSLKKKAWHYLYVIAYWIINQQQVPERFYKWRMRINHLVHVRKKASCPKGYTRQTQSIILLCACLWTCHCVRRCICLMWHLP